MLDRIKQMAEDAGFDDYEQDEMLARFAQLVAEDCAKVAMNMPRVWDIGAPDPQHRIYAAIRARYGTKE